MIKPLTSLRFLFAMMVFISHLQFVQGKFLAKIYIDFFHEGRLGVSFFFILSGFILSLTYKEKIQNGTINKKEFWLTRFARIYPLHLLTLFIAIPISLDDLYGGFITAAAKLSTNLFLVQSFTASQEWYFTFNKLSWSISDEAFFYFLFPFTIIFLYKFPRFIKHSLPLLLLIPIGIYFCPEQFRQRYFYVNPITRFSDFYLGILLYNLFQSNRLIKYFQSIATATIIELGAILLFVTAFLFYPNIPDAYRFSCYYWVPMAILIFCFAHQKGIVSKILSNKTIVYLGEISFGFYMLQQLLIRYFLLINDKYKMIHNEYLIIAIVFTVTLIASHLSFKLIELPCKNLIKRKYKSTSPVLR